MVLSEISFLHLAVYFLPQSALRKTQRTQDVVLKMLKSDDELKIVHLVKLP
jgi:hypothetical protein